MKFLNANDVRTALRSREIGNLTQGLMTLRNQLTIRSDEDTPLPHDDRLLLAKDWLEKSPGAQDVFSLIGRVPKPSPNVLSLCLGVLSSLLNLLSTHFIYHTLGDPIVKTLLSAPHMRQLNSNLSETSSDLILSTLKVLNAMSTFAGGVEKRSIIDGIAWGQKSLQKLFFLRRKGKAARETDPTIRPDIRTLYIYLILSFLSNTTPTPIKLSVLEQHRDVFLLIFKGISQDPYVVARLILEVCWEGIWNDPKIKRTLKIGLFNEPTLNHLLKLYARDSPEDDIADNVPANLIHHFMLAIMTRPGVGICFRDRGWYPRENTGETLKKSSNLDAGDEPAKEGGKIYNKILANFVKGLKINEDMRQQELALKIFEACPELVTGYWGAANLTLEPRLSSRWITNISILGTIVSLPIPTSSFLLPHTLHHNPSPPPLSSVLANILPSALNKAYLTKGLQSSSSLVQHCTALVLSKCLFKLNTVFCNFRQTALILEEDDDTGQWLKRCRELLIEAERRVPDLMVIVALVQHKHALVSWENNIAKAALLTESALRLLWLYHKLFPRLIAEVRFDVGKLLLSAFDTTNESEDVDETDVDRPSIHESQNGLDVLRQLHVLRLLKENDQFAWLSRPASSPYSHLHAVFTLYIKTSHTAVRGATSGLLIQLLSSSILFSHDPAELDLWLSALPRTQRALNATAPDGTPLTDESTGVLAFLEDCIQRCSKTPYRYLEDRVMFFSDPKGDKSDNEDTSLTRDDPGNSPSPLLMTVLEQLRAKVNARLLSASDMLAIITFIRKLSCGLTSKLRDLRHAWKIASRLDVILASPAVVTDSSVMRDAIRRECGVLSHTLDFIQNPLQHISTPASPVVQNFLKQVEDVSIPSSKLAACHYAYELVDWIRLISPPLHPSEVRRLFDNIVRFYPPAVMEFFYQLDPQLGQLWSISDDFSQISGLCLPFELAHLHSTPARLTQTRIKDSLVSLFFSTSAWNSAFERRVSISMHRLAFRKSGALTSLRQTELSLLASIMRRACSHQPIANLNRLKQAIFSDFDSVRELGCSRNLTSGELAELFELVRVSLDPQSSSDQELALVYCTYWMSEYDNATGLLSCMPASPWIPFMDPMAVIRHLDVVIALDSNSSLTDADQHAVTVILNTLTRFTVETRIVAELQHRTRGLLAIRQYLRCHTALDTLLLLIVETGLPLGCNPLPLTTEESGKMLDIITVAQRRWECRSDRLSPDPGLISTFLHLNIWDETTARIVSGVIYRSSDARRTFWAWLTTVDPPEAPSLELVVVALHAYLDVMSLQSEGNATQLPDVWFLAVVQYLFRGQNPDSVRILCGSCIRILLQAFPGTRERQVAHLSNLIMVGQGSFLNIHSIRLFRDLHAFDATLSTLLGDVIQEAFKWMTRQFSGDELSEDDISVLNELSHLVSLTETKPHLVEPVLKAAIQNCLHMPYVVQCLIPLVSSAHLKPAVVNRQLQSIVQHSQLFRIAGPFLPSREPIIQLLHSLFYTHPINTCQSSHVVPLARLYGGTLSLSDRLLLSVFHLYENQRKESAASIIRNWSPSPSAPPPPSQDTIQVITSLDAGRVFRTCTSFPTSRCMDGKFGNSQICDGSLYDPTFLTLLVVQLLSEHKNLSTTEWVQVFRSNIVSLVICVLTSRKEAFRSVGVVTIAGVFQRVKGADFLERDQVIYILNILRDLLPSSRTASSTPRLPTYPIILLAHALRATFYPSSFLYPVVSRFLLQRPELDITDVPMLYSLLYSSENGEWAKERTWMIRFLTEAMNEGGARDWSVLKRRHTWDLVASMWQATRPEEQSFRKDILEFFANLSSNQHAITSLVLRSSILTWIEMQLESKMANEAEYAAWIKILENIIVTVDGCKAEKATRGGFSAIFARCLCQILHAITPPDTQGVSAQIGLLQLTSRVLLRLTNQFFEHSDMLANVLRTATNVLRTLEPLVPWTSGANFRRSSNASKVLGPPHRARGLFDVIGNSKEGPAGDAWHTMEAWAESVATLWRVAMALEHSDSDAWNALTCRLLVLRVSPRFDTCSQTIMELVEWARRETLACLLQRDGEKVRMEK